MLLEGKVLLLCTAFILTLAIGIGIGMKDPSIRSKSPLTPTIELVIENNKVDTIYVYKHPKQ